MRGFAATALRAIALIATGFSVRSAVADEIDTRPLPLKVKVAFPDVKWPGWKSPEETGVSDPLRPILVTPAPDSSNRVFIPTQQGVLYVLPNNQQATTANVFLDISEKVSYREKQNEEGFLGLAFHPKYRENGQFFVYYTNKAKKRQNIVARYHVSKDDPNKADPNSEEILLTLDKPFWNHDGGTLAFGPDGFLYIALGDGGLANDPYKNGQNLSKLLGKMLRIDVDHKQGDLPYAIPADNPFAGKEGARPEIWAYGLRNVWRFAFDSETGTLWAADVGQDTYEEIDLIVKGGNYGWNIREGLHPFKLKRQKAVADTGKPANVIDPIWEYNHDVGKSITGGFVYRGKKIPELQGAYIYADYVAGKLWALRYDPEQKKVTANRPIPVTGNPAVMSFGTDQDNEIYFTTASAKGQGVFMILPAD
ncbi:MAG TPA: PQQ-dependent sugar dehydrogenase [Planctomycetaceae bacterium]|jgi:glucose/arabinose dehydrogenase|nr:PQQ-dependent sugar dehydrogenase [Planctomycetaceae bacterium]